MTAKTATTFELAVFVRTQQNRLYFFGEKLAVFMCGQFALWPAAFRSARKATARAGNLLGGLDLDSSGLGKAAATGSGPCGQMRGF